MNGESYPKKILRVAADINSDKPLPQVIVSESELELKETTTLEWQAIKDGVEFKFANKPFLSDSDAFTNIESDDYTITCVFDYSSSDPKNKYHIVIESGSGTYDTMQRDGPDIGKPVVRN